MAKCATLKKKSKLRGLTNALKSIIP